MCLMMTYYCCAVSFFIIKVLKQLVTFQSPCLYTHYFTTRSLFLNYRLGRSETKFYIGFINEMC